MKRKINKDRVLRELACIAFANTGDYLEIRDGSLQIRDTHDLSKNALAAVAAIERGTGGLKVKFYDKLKALELLGKYLALFEGTSQEGEEYGLLEALLLASKKEVKADGIPELQRPADAGSVLVEPAGTTKL